MVLASRTRHRISFCCIVFPCQERIAMKLERNQWNIGHLHRHLQYAVDLEIWTIPFYMSDLYSIQDRSSAASQAIQSVINQEMLHVQMASNVSNAYGLSPRFSPPPAYVGDKIPHL